MLKETLTSTERRFHPRFREVLVAKSFLYSLGVFVFVLISVV